VLLRRIAKRGREMEKKIDSEYLRKIDAFYKSYTERIKKEEPKTQIVRVMNDESASLDTLAEWCCKLLKNLSCQEPKTPALGISPAKPGDLIQVEQS
jgi:deoxyadenosine/deoxycytidine kinase